MAREDNTAQNRDRILREAEALFAEKGFDATSVSSVAEAAGVNKALVYYYFENKDDLLASLFANMMAEMRERAGSGTDHPELRDKVAGEVAYLAERRHTLALLLMQALKQGEASPALFDVAGRMVEEELTMRGFPKPSADGPASERRRRALVHEFFTGVVPVAAFVTLRDKFCEHFGFDPHEAEAFFLDALERSHFDSHVEPPEE